MGTDAPSFLKILAMMTLPTRACESASEAEARRGALGVGASSLAKMPALAGAGWSAKGSFSGSGRGGAQRET